jgi:peptidase E
MKILLTSDGLSTENINKILLDNSDKNWKVAILATNTKTEISNYYINIIKNNFENIGYKNLEVIDFENYHNYDLSKYNIFYVCGGNTFKIFQPVFKTSKLLGNFARETALGIY